MSAPIYDCGAPDCTERQQAFGPDRTAAIAALAALALSVTEIALDVPPGWRGRELTLEELRLCARGARRYVVREEIEP